MRSWDLLTGLMSKTNPHVLTILIRTSGYFSLTGLIPLQTKCFAVCNHTTHSKHDVKGVDLLLRGAQPHFLLVLEGHVLSTGVWPRKPCFPFSQSGHPGRGCHRSPAWGVATTHPTSQLPQNGTVCTGGHCPLALECGSSLWTARSRCSSPGRAVLLETCSRIERCQWRWTYRLQSTSLVRSPLWQTRTWCMRS